MNNPWKLNPDLRTCMRAGLCLTAFAVLPIVLGLLFVLDAHTPLDQRFREESFIENAQVCLLLASTICFAVSGRFCRKREGLATLLAGMAMIALVREMDWEFDDITHGFWKVPALLVAVAMAGVFWRVRAGFWRAAAEMTTSPSWAWLSAGFLTVLVTSRIYGWKGNWHALLGTTPYTRSIKRAVEEGTELIGYTLIALGAVTFLLECLAARRANKLPSATVENGQNDLS